MEFLKKVKLLFEKIDGLRDQLLFLFIKPYWPRWLTPNQLTFARILISLCILVLLFYYENDNKILIIALFAIGAITDLLDGSIARGLDKETKLGIILDPIADRFLIIPIAFYSLFPSEKFLLFWLILLEVVSGISSAYSQKKGFLIKSNIFGKVKMVFQSIVFLAILFYFPDTPPSLYINLLWFSSIILILSIILKVSDYKKINPVK